eukprot:m.265800 g.265800  ORF g.265800 m.265800 type:complete len:52 (+) comp63843_c0_seq1:216-371(+)
MRWFVVWQYVTLKHTNLTKEDIKKPRTKLIATNTTHKGLCKPIKNNVVENK